MLSGADICQGRSVSWAAPRLPWDVLGVCKGALATLHILAQVFCHFFGGMDWKATLEAVWAFVNQGNLAAKTNVVCL